MLAELFQRLTPPRWETVTKYMDNIVIGETSPEKLGEEATAIWQAVNKAEIETPSGKYLWPCKEGEKLRKLSLESQ